MLDRRSIKAITRAMVEILGRPSIAPGITGATHIARPLANRVPAFLKAVSIVLTL